MGATPDTNLIIIILVAILNLATAVIALLTKKDIKQLEQNTNGKMDALLITTKQLAQAQGLAEGLEQGREENKKLHIPLHFSSPSPSLLSGSL